MFYMGDRYLTSFMDGDKDWKPTLAGSFIGPNCSCIFALFQFSLAL